MTRDRLFVLVEETLESLESFFGRFVVDSSLVSVLAFCFFFFSLLGFFVCWDFSFWGMWSFYFWFGVLVLGCLVFWWIFGKCIFFHVKG